MFSEMSLNESGVCWKEWLELSLETGEDILVGFEKVVSESIFTLGRVRWASICAVLKSSCASLVFALLAGCALLAGLDASYNSFSQVNLSFRNCLIFYLSSGCRIVRLSHTCLLK